MDKIPVIFIILAGILSSCVSKQREAELLDRIAALEILVDDCYTGAEKLCARMELKFDQHDYDSCKVIYMEMELRHPESELFPRVKMLYDSILRYDEVQTELRRARQAARDQEERLRIAREREEKLAAIRELIKTDDDITHITRYEQPYFIHDPNSNNFSICIETNGLVHWLRLKISYRGGIAINFENVYLNYGPATTKKIEFDIKEDRHMGKDSIMYWELIETSVPEDLENYLREFAQSTNSAVKLTGDHQNIRTLSYFERKGILAVLKAYDALREGFEVDP